MNRTRPRVRMAAITTAVVATAVLTGCMGSGVRFTNVSDTWLNVAFFVGTSEIGPDSPEDLYRCESVQVEPGETAQYRPSGDLVHIKVQTVSPTWVPTGRQSWLELLTAPPIHVVASGRDDKLDFKSFHGEIALIPQKELDAGRYVYHQTAEPATAKTAKSATPASPVQVTDAPDGQPRWDN